MALQMPNFEGSFSRRGRNGFILYFDDGGLYFDGLGGLYAYFRIGGESITIQRNCLYCIYLVSFP